MKEPIPISQNKVKNFYWFILGITALGVLLDSVNNAISLITLQKAIWLSAATAVSWVIVNIIVSQYGLKLTNKIGKGIILKKIGNRYHFFIAGAIFLFWIPTLFGLNVKADNNETPISRNENLMHSRPVINFSDAKILPPLKLAVRVTNGGNRNAKNIILSIVTFQTNENEDFISHTVLVEAVNDLEKLKPNEFRNFEADITYKSNVNPFPFNLYILFYVEYFDDKLNETFYDYYMGVCPMIENNTPRIHEMKKIEKEKLREYISKNEELNSYNKVRE